MKRFLTFIAAAVGLASTTYAQLHFMIGSADLAAPVGWSSSRRMVASMPRFLLCGLVPTRLLSISS